MRQVQVENLDGIPLLGVTGDAVLLGHQRVMKRMIDVGLTVLSAPAWLLLFLLVAVAIRVESKGPVLYTQKRIGLNGKAFDLIKFRSMIPNADELRALILACKERQGLGLVPLLAELAVGSVAAVLREREKGQG